MKRALILSLGVMLVFAAGPAGRTSGERQKAGPAIGPIDGGSLVTLRGNTRPEAKRENDRGPVADEFRLDHLFLLLRRPPELESALEEYTNQLEDPDSPNYHKWLTAQELGQEYGPPSQTIDTVTNWLSSYGFEINAVYPNHVVIDFSGTVGQVRQAFHTQIHHLFVEGKQHIANMSDPKIPAALAQAVVGVVSLSDFMPHPMVRMRSQFTFAGCGATCYMLVPADLATIYNFNPIFVEGYTGQGQTVVVIEDTDVFSTTDWSTFRSTFGLSGYSSGTFTQVHPASTGVNNCTDPGSNADDGEAILDAEWASAAAPSAAIVLASCADTTNFGGFIALQNLLNATGTPPAIVSVSYGDSETDDGATFNAAINTLYQQAVTEGVSVFVAAGDQNAAVSDRGAAAATHGINVSGWASTVYDVAVGGTDFGDTFAGTNSTYWSLSNNSATYESALSYVPEIPWNDSCASVLIATFEGITPTYGSAGFCNSVTGAGFLMVSGGSGGPSGCATGAPSTAGVVTGTCAGYAKPSWQSVFGNPSDSVRDLPDVSLFAANGVWGHAYIFCWSDVGNGGTSCSGDPSGWSSAGGTSFASPIMAGVQALINQAKGSRMGNPNPTFYPLAKSEYGGSGNSSCNSSLGNTVGSSCIFYDVRQGDMDVDCQALSGILHNCYLPSGTYGVLSTSNSAYQPAYGTTTGWDFATGIGTVNVANLVNALAVGVASFSPPSFGFSSQVIGTKSTAKPLTLTNTGLGSLTITALSIAGANAGDFSETDNCPRSPNPLASSAVCTIQVSFTPAAAGVRKSSISVTDNAASRPQTIVLTGVGSAASPSPTSLTFASQTVGTSSAAQTITLTNKGSTTMSLYEVGIGGTNAGDYSATTTCGSSLAASASCTVSVSFKPTATGTRTASILFSDNAGASPQSVSLSGTGM
jgi:subtilase family serine protease